MSTTDEKRTSSTKIHTVNAFETEEKFQKSRPSQTSIRHTNEDRDTELKNATAIIEEVFALPSVTTPKLEQSNKNTDEVVKKFLKTGNQKLQWLSYEGSLIISALIGISNEPIKAIRLEQLPESDRVLLQNNIVNCSRTLVVALNQYQNFVFRTDEFSKQEFIFGNRITSIPPEESSRFGNGPDVKVEQKGKEILIGDRIKLEKSRIQDLLQKPDSLYHPHSETQPTKGFQPRSKVSGRNAYEIRADVLEMALDWAKHADKGNVEDVLEIADLFYGFVEHK